MIATNLPKFVTAKICTQVGSTIRQRAKTYTRLHSSGIYVGLFLLRFVDTKQKWQ